MCGLVGAYGDCSPYILDKMTQKIKHRGPDNLSTLSLNTIHLAHTRLSIIDLSPDSNQPLWDEKKIVCIVFNGEIYNYKSLQQELITQGYTFASAGDAEVLLNLYLQHGTSCLDKLNGIFSFAIWDSRNNELFIARDRFGVKPLYYTENADGFYFASEVKSLLTIPTVSRELNYDALLKTIVFLWSPGPDTVLKNIFKLEPGNYLIVKDKKIIKKIEYYTWPTYSPEKLSTAEACQHIQTALQKSVTAQLVADVPVGAFLSGGLDSSLIVAMAKEAGTNLHCFTIEAMTSGKNNDGFIDDLPYAKKVAKYLDVNLDIIKTDPNIIKLLAKMIYHLDEPQADPAPINILLIGEQARKRGIKVLFSGAGGDDIFTGYRRHLAIKFEKYWSYLPKSFRMQLQHWARKLPKNNPKLRRISKMFSYAGCTKDERLLSYFYWIDPAIARNLFTDKIKEQLSANPMEPLLSMLNQRPETNRLEKMLYMERRYFLVDHNFNYTDKMSMAHGVEVRVPFLDERIADVASKIHVRIKQRQNKGKWILKKMAERYLPKSIIHRPKSGFGAPLRQWLKADLKSLVDDLLSTDSLNSRGIFKPETVHHLIKQDRSGKEDYSYPIFSLLCIELWCRIFIDENLSLISI